MSINFYQGDKDDLVSSASSMEQGDLAVATDEMQWYMKYGNELEVLGINQDSIFEITGCKKLEITEANKYIDLSNTSVSIVDGRPVVSGTSPTYSYTLVECSAGDKFTINGTGGVQTRLWGFVDSNGLILDKAAASVSKVNFVVTAPENSAWLIIHDNSNKDSFIGEFIPLSIKDINNKITFNDDIIGKWIYSVSSYNNNYQNIDIYDTFLSGEKVYIVPISTLNVTGNIRVYAYVGSDYINIGYIPVGSYGIFKLNSNYDRIRVSYHLTAALTDDTIYSVALGKSKNDGTITGALAYCLGMTTEFVLEENKFKNIYTEDILTLSGKYIDQYGELGDHNDFKSSDFFPICENCTLTLKAPIARNTGRAIAFYTNDNVNSYIRGYSTSVGDQDLTFNVPKFAKYVRFSYPKNTNFTVQSNILDTQRRQSNALNDLLYEKAIIVKEDFTLDGYISLSGTILQQTNFYHTALYKLPSYAKKITILRSADMNTACVVAFFKKNEFGDDSFISGYRGTSSIIESSPVVIDVPENAKYYACTYKYLNGYFAYKIPCIYVSETKLFENKSEENEDAQALLSGCTFSVIGDSYTAFPGWIPNNQNAYYPEASDTVKTVDKMWWYLLANKANMTPLIIDGWSGSTICTHTREGVSVSSPYVVRVKNTIGEGRILQPKPDYIFILGGQNDNSAQATIGTVQYSDWTEEDLYKFAPAFCYLIDYLIKWNPGATIINITNTGGMQQGYIDAMAEACTHYGIKNIVLQNIDKSNGHPTATGMVSIANQIFNGITN